MRWDDKIDIAIHLLFAIILVGCCLYLVWLDHQTMEMLREWRGMK